MKQSVYTQNFIMVI